MQYKSVFDSKKSSARVLYRSCLCDSIKFFILSSPISLFEPIIAGYFGFAIRNRHIDKKKPSDLGSEGLYS